MLTKQIIINSNLSETRIALLEREELAELYIERHRKQHLLGNVYLGKIIRVIPGMQSAFIDLGIGQSGFLYAKDVVAGDIAERYEGDEPYPANNQAIEKSLKAGQRIMVQVVKEPYGHKGPRVTMGVAIPGRYLVLLPNSSRVGVSRKISDERERKRLKEMVEKIRDHDIGIIVRTAAENIELDHLQRDFTYLGEIWQRINSLKGENKGPTLLHMDYTIVSRFARDLYSDDVQRIVIDDAKSYGELLAFFKKIDHQSGAKIELYRGKVPLFDVYGLEQDIDLALQARVDLASGGFIVIEETEALTTFDINTGKFVGRKNAGETVLQINLEAAKVIINQIRIRNIGGIIVIDFIDMNNSSDREKVYHALLQYLKPDKANTNVLKISEFGLVQMTRKRTRESLEKTLTSTCSFCDGCGHHKSNATVAYEIFRAVQRTCAQLTSCKRLRLEVREDIYNFIVAEEKTHLGNLQDNLGIRVELIPFPYHDPAYGKEAYLISTG